MMDGGLLLFDVDGTLTKPRQVIDEEFYEFLMNDMKPYFKIALVGGSDLSKISEQMGPDFELNHYDYIFPENGLVAIKDGVEIARQSLEKYLQEEKSQRLINYCLEHISKLKLPVKRGTFVEYRSGLINICPVGRSCTQEQRNSFAQYDAEHKIRENFVNALRRDLPDLQLHYSIGGQISFDVFPKGWDKRYCLRFVEDEFKGKIYFFGDKTSEGGNDYEIFSDPRVIGHTVTSPKDTKLLLEELLNEYITINGTN